MKITYASVVMVVTATLFTVTACIPQLQQIGAPPTVSGGPGAEEQAKPKFAAVTRTLDKGSIEAGLVFNENYRQYAESAISRGVGLMEPIFRLTFDDDLAIGLKVDWETTRALHDRLSKKLNLLPFEDTKAFGDAELAYFKKRSEIVRQKIAARLEDLKEIGQGRSSWRLAVSDFSKMSKNDNADSYGVPDAPPGMTGSPISLLAAAKVKDTSPYATPFYSKVLMPFEKKGASFLLSPSISVLQDYADLQASQVVIEPYRIMGDGMWRRIQDTAQQVDETKPERTFSKIAGNSDIKTDYGVNSGVMSLQGFYGRILAKVMGDMEMETSSLSASIVAIDFLKSAEINSGKLAPYRGMANRLTSGLSGGQDSTLDQILSSTNEQQSTALINVSEQDRIAFIKSRVSNLITPVDELRFYAPSIFPFGLTPLKTALQRSAKDKATICNLNACSRQGPAVTFAYIQAGLVATDLQALQGVQTREFPPIWNDFLSCDSYTMPPPSKSAMSFLTTEPLGGLEGMLRAHKMLMCQYAAVRRAAAAHKQETPTKLVDALIGTFDSARAELKLSVGLKTRALD